MASVEIESQVAAAKSAVASEPDTPALLSTSAPIEASQNQDDDSDTAAAPRRLAPPVEMETAKHSSAPSEQAAEATSAVIAEASKVEDSASDLPAVARIDMASNDLPVESQTAPKDPGMHHLE